MRIINLIEDTKGNNHCLYEHGLSFYIETDRHRLLLDSGATGAFIQNAELLGVDLSRVDTLILSHGHYDHAGGIRAFAEVNPGAAIYAQTSVGEDFYHSLETGEKYIGIDKEIPALPQFTGISGDMEIDSELFLFSGVKGTRYPSGSNLQLKRKTDRGMVQDDFRHEQCLVITQKEKHILMSGCAHGGILNILDRYAEIFHSSPDVVISGFHMMQKEAFTAADILRIQNTAAALMETGAVFYTGHCTGAEAYRIMKEIMGDRLKAVHSGDVLF